MFDQDDPNSLSDDWSDLELSHNNNQEHLDCLSSMHPSAALQRETESTAVQHSMSIPSTTTPHLTICPPPPHHPLHDLSGGLSSPPLDDSSLEDLTLNAPPLDEPLFELPLKVPPHEPPPGPPLVPPLHSALHCSSHNCHSPTCWGYDCSQGAGYEAIVSFIAFIEGAEHTQSYFTFISGDQDSSMFDFS